MDDSVQHTVHDIQFAFCCLLSASNWQYCTIIVKPISSESKYGIQFTTMTDRDACKSSMLDCLNIPVALDNKNITGDNANVKGRPL